MTLLFSRPAGDGPVTHAFVVGVGGYPHAKPGRGAIAGLEARDLPSAADSARYFCDWLLANRDNLVAPLASIEVLVGETGEGTNRYVWQPDLPAGEAVPAVIGNATAQAVKDAGRAWLERLDRRAGDIALFYCCGHGASLKSEPVLFLEDLNGDPTNPWSCINVRRLASAFCKNPTIGGALLFVDACGETIPGFALADALDTRFWPVPAFNQPEIPKALLFCAAPSGLLAYDGQMPNSDVRLGRFTQTLVKALDGAAVEPWRQGWAVSSAGLGHHLKKMQQFYVPGWNDHPFEPTPVMSLNDVLQIVRPANPVVPVLARTNPAQAMGQLAFCVGDHPPPPPPRGQDILPDPGFQAWRFEMSPRREPTYAIAYNDDAYYYMAFTPDRPLFDHVQLEIE